MDREAYFKHISAQIDQTDREVTAHDNQLTDDEIFLAELMLQIAPALEMYKNALGTKGVLVDLKIHAHTFSFMMYYRNGNHKGFGIDHIHRTNSFQLVVYFTGHGGKDMTGTTGDKITRLTWSSDQFEKFIQDQIDDYSTGSVRNGGYLRQK